MALISRRLVIDSDVLCGAGDEAAEHPRSMMCREFLLAVKQICHRAVLVEDLENQWEEHSSVFAKVWRKAMEQKGKLVHPAAAQQSEIASALQKAKLTENQREIVTEDLHLLQAAAVAEGIIVSMDEEVRGILKNHCSAFLKLGGIYWVNPERPKEQAINWLKNGAKPEPSRKLLSTKATP